MTLALLFVEDKSNFYQYWEDGAFHVSASIMTHSQRPASFSCFIDIIQRSLEPHVRMALHY